MTAAPHREYGASFALDSGQWVEVSGRVHGRPDGECVIVLGGISAGKNLIDTADDAGWWPGVVRESGALDPSRFRLLGIDFLGEHVAPFPTIEDQARAVIALADASGMTRFSIVGASYGGAVSLALASLVPARIEKLILLAAAGRVHPMASAWRSIQRGIVRAAIASGDPKRGVDLARRLAMTSYRTADEFAARFRTPAPTGHDARGIGAWLAHHGHQYSQKTDAKRFLALSKSLDQVEIAFSRITAPASLLGFDSDQLIPPGDVIWTAEHLPGASLEIQPSLYGHDGFLKDVDIVNAFLARAFDTADGPA